MEKKAYKYDLHVHTSQVSACGYSTGAEQALAYKKAGYDGIVITDHFFNGNCAIRDQSLSWEERVAAFCSGYEDAYDMGQRLGLDVFFGLEWNLNSMEFLLYGLTPDWVYAHENLDQYSVQQLFSAVCVAGGMMIQAHPYREDGYIRQQIIYPGLVHGIETLNLGNIRRGAQCNARAFELARKNHMRMICGSDSHSASSDKCGMLFPERLPDAKALIEQVLWKQDQSGEDWYVVDVYQENS